MTRRSKIWLIAALVLLVYVAAAFVLGRVLHLGGGSLTQLRVGLVVLGLLSAAVILWFFRDRGAPKVASGPTADIDAAVAAGQSQLAAARAAKDPRIGALPAVLVLGPAGSTKTTAVVRSGLEPELIAGEAMRGETVAATKSVNLWWTRGNVLVEAGSPLLADDSAWNHLLRVLQPRSLLAALTGKPQAPRMAVVCFGCDEFYKPGSGEAIPAAARVLRARLGAAAQQFGVRLPVYVLFTKADAIPHFEAFVRNLSADEAREPLGASLPPESGSAASYAERATPRLEGALRGLYRSLAERRVPVLAREHAAEWKPAAYEFPREFAKLIPLAVDFLRELGKPSQLAVSPVLRGFYFTGVQAVYVTEVTPEYSPMGQPAQQPARTSGGSVRSATGVFSAEQAMTPPARQAAPPLTPGGGPRTRKLPRWDFLPRIFPDVVLADETAARATQGGTRVGFWRRAALGAAAAVGLLLAIAFSVSYAGNRALQRQASEAVENFAALPANPVDLPPVDALRRLDALGAELDTLSTYEHDGAPLHLRWGLFRGAALYPEVRHAYFAGFDRMLFSTTRAQLLAGLRAFPDSVRPSDDYGQSYGLLKAYLITTQRPERSTVEFLAPVLMHAWVEGRQVDPERMQLAQRQFDTYANELRFGSPYPETADAATIAHARTYLRQFAGSERIYQFMLAEAEKSNPPLQFNRQFPGSAAYVTAPYVVPGAFTKSGYAFMQGAFNTVDRFLQGESWVVGENAQPVDKTRLVAELRARYAADYAEQWRRFLRSATVTRYGSVRDAAQKLAVLSGNQSPLLELFSVVSQNTNIGDKTIAGIFQPVQTVTPPTATDKLIGPGNAPYMTALVTLQSSLEQTASAAGPAGEQAAGQAAGNAAAAKAAARQIAAAFTIDQQGQAQAAVQRLMEEPIANAEPLLTHFGAEQINGRARAFCAAVRPLLAKFPFNANASAQASLPEISTVLRPGTGMLWTFYNDVLQSALQKQGTQYVPLGGSVRLTPEFVAFFNRAAALSDAFFPSGATEPRFSFNVQPQLAEGATMVSVTLEGDIVRATRNSLQTTRVDWPGASHETRLAVQFGSGPEATIAGPFNGTWALFQLFKNADAWQPTPSGYRAEWSLRTQSQGISVAGGGALRVAVNVSPASAALVLRGSGATGAGACTGEVAR